MLLFSERTWKHHCVTLLVPFAVLCRVLAERPAGGRWPVVAVLAFATAAMSATGTGLTGGAPPRLQDAAESGTLVAGPALFLTATQSGAFTDSAGKGAQVYGAYVWAFVALTAGLVGALRPGRAGEGRVTADPARLAA